MKQYEQFYEFKVEDMNSSQVIEDTVLQESDELNKSQNNFSFTQLELM
jgi:hypothetical protein